MSFDQDLRYGLMRSQQVKDLQTFLTDEGYYSGPISGNFLSMTRKSLNNFQKDNGLKVVSKLDKSTREVINQLLLAKETHSSLNISENSNTQQLVTLYDSQGNSVQFVQEQVQMALNSGYSYSLPTKNTQPTLNTTNYSSSNNTQTYISNYTYPQILNSNNNTQNNVPVTSANLDTTPPQVSFITYTNQARSLANWPNGNTTGNKNDNCTNCLVVKTNEPTTIKVEYLERFSGFDNTQENADKIQTWNDGGAISDTHIMIYKGLFNQNTLSYVFRYTIKDSAGNETKQTFTGNGGAEVKWSNGQTMWYDSSIETFKEINNVKTTY